MDGWTVAVADDFLVGQHFVLSAPQVDVVAQDHHGVSDREEIGKEGAVLGIFGGEISTIVSQFLPLHFFLTKEE